METEETTRKVLLLFGERRKIVDLGISGNSGDKSAILMHARTLFSLSDEDVYAQEYVEEFEEWIDIEDDFVAQHKQKIKVVSVVVASALPNQPFESTALSSPITGSSTPDGPEQAEDTQLPGDTSSHQSNYSAISVRPDWKMDKDKSLPLSKPFPLPDNFSPIVMAGLKAGALSGKAMTKFITEVASSIYRHSAYPTKAEKEHVAIQCTKKYPFLESSCGNGFGYIVAGITERLKYLRKPYKRPERASPEVDSPATAPPVKKTRPVKPTSFIAVMSAGEDEASHERNLKLLQSFAKQQNPDPASIKDLMDRTFALRRAYLQDDNKQFTISSFLESYPFLSHESEIVEEFDRVVQVQSKSFRMCKLAWLELVPKVLELAKGEGTGLIKFWLQQLNESTDEGTHSLLAAILLAYLLTEPRFKPDHSRVITLLPENADIAQAAAKAETTQPFILAVGSIAHGIKDAYLVLEKKVLFHASKLTDTVPLLFSMFFVFNLAYVGGANSFYLFLEHVFLKTKVAHKKHSISKLIVRLHL